MPMKSGPEQYQLWDSFLAEWPIERLISMTLDEYGRAGDDRSFIRWLESRLSEMGSIWGGSGFKFGIYGRKAEDQKESKAGRSYSDEYGWYSKCGSTADEAFRHVRDLVVKTASAARDSKLEAIDEIGLGPAFKWKVAFHYQNRVNPLVVGVFSREHLQIFLGDKLGQDTPYPELYRRVIASRNGQDLLEFGIGVWEEARKKLAAMWNPTNAEALLKGRYNYFAQPTQKLAGFVTPSGRQLALRRDGKAVRAYVEAQVPQIEGSIVRETYAATQERSSNLPSQAPKLTQGNEAKLLQFDSAEALTAFCDSYDESTNGYTMQSTAQTASEQAAAMESLNTILYGPPGTGKTYRTAELAVQICDGKADADRAQLMRRYEELRREGRIRFVTFHQSYSYEDFVEGLRPELNNGQVTYRVRPGIFREACDAARRSRLVKPGLDGKPLSARTFYKMSLGTAGTPKGDKVFQESIEKGYVMLGWGEDIDFTECKSIEEVKQLIADERPDINKPESQARFVWQLKNDLQKGDIVIVSDGNRAFRAIAEITGDYEYAESATFHQARRVRWLGVFEGGRSVDEVYDRDFMMSTLYRLQREGLNLNAIEPLIRSGAETVNQRFVLIVDEINRANISKVIGELITLMEADKREGAPNALTVKLPYSGDDFSVPDNLFILGTMNTADRSIALLDTALRRRYDFIELRPEPEQLAALEDIDLCAMLTALNRRIEYLYDRDHVVGHAYFMSVRSLDDLENVMRRRVLPLLQEYFYEDWSKIQVVLNDHAGLFIEASQATLDTNVAADADLEPKMRYQVRIETFPAQAYFNIYV